MQNQLSVGLDKMQEAAESALEMGKILSVQAKDVDKVKNEANIVKEKVQHSVKEAEKVAAVVETVKQVPLFFSCFIFVLAVVYVIVVRFIYSLY